jgi:ADP-ribose pyrophosphatase YjhB (NUDIX family)
MIEVEQTQLQKKLTLVQVQLPEGVEKTPYKFCSQCGKDKWIKVNESQQNCLACGYEHYISPIAAACVLVYCRESDELLLIQRGINPGYGLWAVPGGVIDVKERAEDAAVRELREETGVLVDVEKITFLSSFTNKYLYQKFVWPTLDLFFYCLIEHVKDKPTIQSCPKETLDTQWVKFSDIDFNTFAFESSMEGVRLFTEKVRGWGTV